jgi:hypothetical protein
MAKQKKKREKGVVKFHGMTFKIVENGKPVRNEKPRKEKLNGK